MPNHLSVKPGLLRSNERYRDRPASLHDVKTKMHEQVRPAAGKLD